MKKTTLLLLPALIFANPFTAALDEEASWLKEETFVISASKTKQSIDKAAASITVIDSDMIDNMGATTVLDILRTVPGLGISQSRIWNTQIEVRGIKTWFSEKVLILLDGHSLNSNLVNGGATNAFDKLNVENIKRVEIIRGPASALYGANAFTGLINIITKDAKDIDGTEVSLKLGSYDTAIYNLLFGQKVGALEIVANVNFTDTDGYEAYVANDAAGNSGHTHPYSQRVNSDLKIDYEGLYLKAKYSTRKEGPGYGVAFALNDESRGDVKSYFLELGYNTTFNDTYEADIRVYTDYFAFDNTWEVFPEGLPAAPFTDGMYAVSGIKNRVHGTEALFKINKENYTVISGASIENQKQYDPYQRSNYNPQTGAPLGSIQDFSDPLTNWTSDAERDFFALYGELLYDAADNFRITTGVRYDHYSDFGGVWNPRVGVLWKAANRLNIKLMHGEAFRAPTFAELYNKNNPSVVGNPDLKPEKVKTSELAIGFNATESMTTSLTLFGSEITDIIQKPGTTYVNDGKVVTTGIEVEGKYTMGRGSYIYANYTYQHPENKLTGKDIADIPNHKAYLGVNYRIDRNFNLYADASCTGSQKRDPSDAREKLDESIVSNLTLHSKGLFHDDMTMKVSVNNLFDEKGYDPGLYNKYVLPAGSQFDYPLPERNFMFEVAYKF